MANQITLTSVPQAVQPLIGGDSTITATVRDSVSGAPVAGVNVTFTTTTIYAVLTPSSGVTNANGVITTTLRYPSPSPGPAGFTGIGLVRVVAAIAGASASVLVNYYEASLRQARVLNAVNDPITGTLLLSKNAIDGGVQAIVYHTGATQNLEVITFYWGNISIQRAVTSAESAWLININSLFIPEQTLSPGVYPVWYSIEDFAGNIIGAKPVVITIVDSPYFTPTLLAPTFNSALNGIINRQNALTGVVITLPVAQQPAIQAGDDYTIYMQLTTLAGAFIRLEVIRNFFVQNPNANIEYTIPSRFFENLNGVNAEFYYLITKYSPDSILRSFSTRMYVDTVPPGQ